MAETLSSYGAKFSLKDASGCLLWLSYILIILIYFLLKSDKSSKAIIKNNVEKLLKKIIYFIRVEIPL